MDTRPSLMFPATSLFSRTNCSSPLKSEGLRRYASVRACSTPAHRSAMPNGFWMTTAHGQRSRTIAAVPVM